MKNYFLAPRSGERKHGNFESTIKHGVPLLRISQYLNDEEKKILSSENVIYAWGNRKGTKKAWEKMQIGDSVIFYSKGSFVLIGDVYFKKHDPSMALALWPADSNGNPWEYTYFLKNLRYVSMPASVFNAAVDFKSNFRLQGFIELKPDRVSKIVKRYGSVEEMFDIFTDTNSLDIPTGFDKVHVNIDSDIVPEVIENPDLRPGIKKPKNEKSRIVKKIDYIQRNISNSVTGNKGEEIVVKYEKDYLIRNKRPDLAEKVCRVSVGNDSLGYDVLSFYEDGAEKYIEVKTTTVVVEGMRFFVSINEYKVGKDRKDYFIYFVEHIHSNKPKITIICNPMDDSKFLIEPEGYIFEARRLNF